MRVTQSITDRLYHKNNNRMLNAMLKNQTRIYTGKQYLRASEDAINASKAMTVRRQLRDLDMYDDNLKSAKSVYSAAETNLTTLSHDIYLDVQTQLETACNGTYNQDDLNIFAQKIDEFATLAVETMNVSFAERQLFGGSNNSTTPFTVETGVDADGNTFHTVSYNGVVLNNNDDPSTYPGSKPVYVDIGIGIQYDNNYEVNPQTAADVSFNGAKVLGCGVADDGYSKNYIQLMYDAADALRKGDVAKANGTLDRLNMANSTVLTEITTLGSKQNSMDFYIEKNADYRYSLQERQNDVEGCDLNEEITQMEATDAAYQAILQLSSRILPKSIFDFV